jgi:hypothetical protein
MTAAVIAASAGDSDAGGPDRGSVERRGASFADGLGPVGGTCAECGDATGASGAGTAGTTAWGVAGNDVSALVSASAVLMRCHRLGRVAAGSVMPASGDTS